MADRSSYAKAVLRACLMQFIRWASLTGFINTSLLILVDDDEESKKAVYFASLIMGFLLSLLYAGLSLHDSKYGHETANFTGNNNQGSPVGLDGELMALVGGGHEQEQETIKALRKGIKTLAEANSKLIESNAQLIARLSHRRSQAVAVPRSSSAALEPGHPHSYQGPPG